MKLCGLMKLTLLDFPGKVACTVFTGGCNFRCPFCHNAQLVLLPDGHDSLREETFFSFLAKRRGILDGVCVSGGEPLLHADIADFIRRIREAGFAVKLDTNGSFPEQLRALVREGLIDYVAMDIKHAPAHYGEAVGIAGFDPAKVEQSIDFLLSGAVPYEFRTTVVAELHHDGDFAAIGRRIRGAERYFLQTFRDEGDLLTGGLHAPTREQMEKWRDEAAPFVQSIGLR
ncbi:MAG: anaerobic ribonucleoside-triphosphate reductase activating protein [Clostridia bacterium]|nr:anaerobic ribonucleoside-triphosphate reductase activating protein [Clostridia bacterium]